MPRAVIYISEFQNKLAWKFDISVSSPKCLFRIRTQHTKEIPTHQHLKANLAGRQLHSKNSDRKCPVRAELLTRTTNRSSQGAPSALRVPRASDFPRSHARIGITTVLSAHITVALHSLHPTTRSTSPALSDPTKIPFLKIW